MTKTTLLLKRLYSNFKYILCGTCIYSLLLILYDCFTSDRSFHEMLPFYAESAFVCAIVWLGVKFVLWIQLKNDMCSTGVFNFFSMFFLVGMSVFTIVSMISWLLQGFDIGAFAYSVAVLSIIHIQGKREGIK